MRKKVKLVSNTQIFLDTRRLLNEILDVTPNFPKEYKYTVGARMHGLAIDCLQDIAAAYINRNRTVRIDYLVKFQTEFETLKTLVRVAGERRWIKGQGRLAQIVELIDAIGKQSTAWKRSLIDLED